MSKYKAGDIVTIKGTEFVVLDIEKGTAKDGKDKWFMLLKEPVGSTVFGTTNDYKCSTLRCAVNKWFKKYEVAAYDDLIYSREVSLLTMDGRENYGTLHFCAAPLTFDEYRKYSRYIPDCESYWLATGDGAPGRSGEARALGVYSDGDWLSYGCSKSCAVRPAMWASETLVDQKPNLEVYTTAELLEELQKREQANG